MSIHHSILRAPSVTEKNTIARYEDKYTFKVAKSATKVEIREAVEAIFDVKVVSVNTMNVNGKKKRQGRFIGKRADWKKAIVQLEAGQKIEQFGEI